MRRSVRRSIKNVRKRVGRTLREARSKRSKKTKIRKNKKRKRTLKRRMRGGADLSRHRDNPEYQDLLSGKEGNMVSDWPRERLGPAEIEQRRLHLLEGAEELMVSGHPNEVARQARLEVEAERVRL